MPADRLLHPRCGQSEKITALSDLEYRVWTQYLLSADDFGVMRSSSAPLQNGSRALETKPPRLIVKCLERMIALALLLEFDHQGQRFVFQLDWQDFQKITWPAKTIQPIPPPALLERCSSATRELFEAHPGGRKVLRKTSESSSKVLPKFSESSSEVLSSPHARVPAKRLTANGLGLTARANGSEGGAGETTPDFRPWLLELRAAYPPKAVSSGYGTESAFAAAVLSHGTPAVTFTVMMVNLESQKAGAQWQSGKIPRLDRWLSQGLWEQQHASAAESGTSRTAGNVAALQRFVDRGRT